VGLRVAEVNEQAIAQILRDMSVIAGDHRGAGVLIGPHHLAEVFGVELTGQCGRVHQVTEQHGELTALGVGSRRGDPWGCSQRPHVCWPGEVLVARQGGRCERCGRPGVLEPYDAMVVLAERVRVGIAQFGKEIGQGLCIKLILPLEGAIGDAAALAQQGDHLIDDHKKVHPVSSLLRCRRVHASGYHSIGSRKEIAGSPAVVLILEINWYWTVIQAQGPGS
jgi:hypothetical protein